MMNKRIEKTKIQALMLCTYAYTEHQHSMYILFDYAMYFHGTTEAFIHTIEVTTSWQANRSKSGFYAF